jgi:hypothetical protein
MSLADATTDLRQFDHGSLGILDLQVSAGVAYRLCNRRERVKADLLGALGKLARKISQNFEFSLEIGVLKSIDLVCQGHDESINGLQRARIFLSGGMDRRDNLFGHQEGVSAESSRGCNSGSPQERIAAGLQRRSVLCRGGRAISANL